MSQQVTISLGQELRNALLDCPLTDQKYIPLDVIYEKITAERIREKLPELPWYDYRWWFSSCRTHDLETKLQSARKVVAVLALIARCENLEKLLADGLRDEHLPLSKVDGSVRSRCGGRTFNSFSVCEGRGEFVDLFLDDQWKVLAPSMKFEPEKSFDISLHPQCALPFHCADEIETTGFSVVYKAMLRPSHHTGRENTGPVWVAIKKLKSKNSKDFDLERKNWDQVRSVNNDHLIKPLAICEQAQCIIFPWADGGNLWKFWKLNGRQEIERTADVLRWCLQQLTGLAHAMAELFPENFRHGDLKPDNILHFTTAGSKLGTLKIADLGVSKMHPKEASTGLRDQPTMTKASTLTYQAPEACRIYATLGPRSRNYDSWSVGCIILEFVVWLLYDFSALLNFEGARDVQGNAYYLVKPGPSSESDIKEGAEVHPKVREAICCLKADGRCRGTALGALVRLVESDLLKIVPKERLDSVQLYTELKKILKDAEVTSYLFNGAGPPSPVPEIFSRPPPRSAPQATNRHP